jgi:HEAT repeat protein
LDEYGLVRLSIAALAILFAGALVALFAHGAWMVLYERRNAERLERGRRALLEAATSARVSQADLALLRSLPRRLQIRLFVELATGMAGSQRTWLSSLARDIGLTQAAERLIKSGSWWTRLSAVRLLTVVGGGRESVPPLFDDRNPAVRGAAVEWAGEHAPPEVLARLVEQLAEPQRVGSYELRDALLRLGPPIIPPLSAYLDTHGGAAAEPALEVAAGLPDARFGPAALRLCRDPLPGVRARAASLAGALGGGEAVGVLEAMLDDAEPSVRAAAAASLGRLGHWPAATRIAPLLGDSAWVVRSQSALALRRLGSPGLLLLRRTLSDPDRFAADIARQVLEMPDTTAERDQWR